MKKSLVTLSTVALSLSLSLPSYAAANGSSQANEALDAMKKQTGDHFLAEWSENHQQLEFLSGVLSGGNIRNAKDVKTYIKNHQDLFHLNPKQDLRLEQTTTDDLGMKHFKFVQLVDGVPVEGNYFYVHVGKDGTVRAVNGDVDPSFDKKLDSVTPAIPRKEALEAGWEAIGLTKAETIVKGNKQIETAPGKKKEVKNTNEDVQLVIFEDEGTPKLAYHVVLQFIQPEPGNWQIFVDAKDGSILHKYNAVAYDGPTTGYGYGVLGDYKPLNLYLSGGYYYLYDTTKPMSGVIETRTAQNGTALPGPYLVDYDNAFTAYSEAPAVDANYYAGVVYDFYYNRFGRNSYDNYGSTIRSTVHYGYNYNNAFWNGQQMVYGDGDGSTFRPLSGDLDVVGHEITHAVTERTAGLEYHDQPGALNESMSDVFGVLIEWESYVVGDEVYTPGVYGDALRSLKNPPKYGQPDHMSEYVYTSSDNGGVHTNSGIPNKAGYLTMSQIGRSKSAQIYYRALNLYLGPTSNFSDARYALLQSAADLYGYGSEYNVIANAWNQVGVY
ncbi:MAG TPA: M4 family metallopeptidase [Bacillales bacterium]|nr:M4 family metallopeptidase [Bacillales bacterium]